MKSRWPRRDPALPHQIVLYVSDQGGWGTVHVSCNCRVQKSKGKNRKYESMGVAPDTHTAWRLYNDPNNHNDNGAPFTDEWKGGAAVLRQTAIRR